MRVPTRWFAVTDPEAAKRFYTGSVGLVPAEERAGSAIRYETRGGTWFMIYQSPSAGTAMSTCMRFEVADLAATVSELRDRGVLFEDYDLPGLNTVDGIAEHESGARGAWFKDPDGNIPEVGQYPSNWPPVPRRFVCRGCRSRRP